MSEITIYPEAEEQIEANLIALTADALAGFGISVEGSAVPAAEGEIKTTDDTYVNVAVDLTDPRGDYESGRVPCGYSARVSIRVSFADDKGGTFYRDVRRSVRAVLDGLSGDGCTALDGNGVRCNEFLLSSTSTDIDTSGDNAAFHKVYTVSLVCRYNPETEAN